MKRSTDEEYFTSGEEGEENEKEDAHPENAPKRFKTTAIDHRNRDLSERSKQTDFEMMNALNDKYRNSESVDRECEEIRRSYYVTYMKKVMENLPLSTGILEVSKSIKEEDEFLKMYSVAKTCVHSDLQLQKLVAFNSVFDMVTQVCAKGIHDRVITPHLKNFVTENQLDAAYEIFKNALSSDDNKSSTELHCVAYLIQDELDKEQPLRISNPMYNRFTQQLKAGSEYIIAILQGLAYKPIVPPRSFTEETSSPGNSDEKDPTTALTNERESGEGEDEDNEGDEYDNEDDRELFGFPSSVNRFQEEKIEIVA